MRYTKAMYKNCIVMKFFTHMNNLLRLQITLFVENKKVRFK